VRDTSLTRRELLVLLGTLPVVLTLPSGLVVAATLRLAKLRHWSAPDHTRIVLDLDAPAKFETQKFTDPARVVLEIPGAAADGDFTVSVRDGLVEEIRVQTLGGSLVVQAVLARDAAGVAFSLPPNSGGEAHRVVLDVRKRFTEQETRAQENEVESVRKSGDIVIAIDPGHGGNDPGCIGRDARGGPLYERDVALAVARELGRAIAARPGMRAVLTRDKDYFVPLGRRQQIAQRWGAQLFVSIHCNSAASRAARGSEVFFVSLQGAADKAERELIDRENAADLVGGVAPEDVQTPLVDILMNLKQNEAMRRSERLGEIMLRRLERVPGNTIRGLKQGPLAVLKSITCPSVLVELGFMTNKADVKLLADRDAQRAYASTLAAGVEEYLA
jgi:N-acetylmuramoyl-L-alanine amidase